MLPCSAVQVGHGWQLWLVTLRLAYAKLNYGQEMFSSKENSGWSKENG